MSGDDTANADGSLPAPAATAAVSAAVDKLLAREVGELYLLLDYISGRPDRQLMQLDKMIKNKDNPDGLSYHGIVAEISTIRNKLVAKAALTAEDAAFLLLLKDQLNTMAYPAKGSTIAYTTLFSESGGGRAGTETERSRLAEEAFPYLVAPARAFRIQNRWINWTTFIIAVLSALTLWQFTHGARLAAQFDVARKEESEAAARIYSYLDKRAAKPPPSEDVVTVNDIARYCMLNDKEGPVKVYKKEERAPIDSEIRLMCNDYAFKSARYCVAIGDIGQYRDHWVFHTVSFFLPINRIYTPNDCGRGVTEKQKAEGSPTGKQEDAQSVISVLVMMINFILPMAFGFVGAAVALIRSIQDSVRAYTLSPRDQTLSIIRLILGGIAGVSVGIFLSPGTLGGQAPTSIGLFTLSASGIAFLAGYGADGFFRALDLIISRVFAAEGPTPAAK